MTTTLQDYLITDMIDTQGMELQGIYKIHPIEYWNWGRKSKAWITSHLKWDDEFRAVNYRFEPKYGIWGATLRHISVVGWFIPFVPEQFFFLVKG